MQGRRSEGLLVQRTMGIVPDHNEIVRMDPKGDGVLQTARCPALPAQRIEGRGLFGGYGRPVRFHMPGGTRRACRGMGRPDLCGNATIL